MLAHCRPAAHQCQHAGRRAALARMAPGRAGTMLGAMELIIMVLAPFPIGFLIRNRLAAFVTYIALHGFVFTFQTLNLILEWAGGSQEAFGPYPKASSGSILGYGLVNLVIFAVGLGLVYLGGRVGARRRSRERAVALEHA
jgi:predicted Na+-dependent transporter